MYHKGESEEDESLPPLQRQRGVQSQCQVPTGERSDAQLVQVYNLTGRLQEGEASQLEQVLEIRSEWDGSPLMRWTREVLEPFGNKPPSRREDQERSFERGRNDAVSSAYLHSGERLVGMLLLALVLR